ncbi:hypothetical protein CEXT_415261 [Caerostris extrusa]|uniref:Uncharacterized protein n=1 Tax=Caerostris extrusa TaxID=172846 RepID=A0AAV4MVS6_CAEEX|nr:hypothetical protein CEXT_415261 [Caerostris extrusa]
MPIVLTIKKKKKKIQEKHTTDGYMGGGRDRFEPIKENGEKERATDGSIRIFRLRYHIFLLTPIVLTTKERRKKESTQGDGYMGGGRTDSISIKENGEKELTKDLREL